jgi:hypothetical protein
MCGRFTQAYIWRASEYRAALQHRAEAARLAISACTRAKVTDHEAQA